MKPSVALILGVIIAVIIVGMAANWKLLTSNSSISLGLIVVIGVLILAAVGAVVGAVLGAIGGVRLPSVRRKAKPDKEEKKDESSAPTDEGPSQWVKNLNALDGLILMSLVIYQMIWIAGIFMKQSPSVIPMLGLAIAMGLVYWLRSFAKSEKKSTKVRDIMPMYYWIGFLWVVGWLTKGPETKTAVSISPLSHLAQWWQVIQTHTTLLGLGVIVTIILLVANLVRTQR